MTREAYDVRVQQVAVRQRAARIETEVVYALVPE
jgi:hypothetical protein